MEGIPVRHTAERGDKVWILHCLTSHTTTIPTGFTITEGKLTLTHSAGLSLSFNLLHIVLSDTSKAPHPNRYESCVSRNKEHQAIELLNFIIYKQYTRVEWQHRVCEKVFLSARALLNLSRRESLCYATVQIISCVNDHKVVEEIDHFQGSMNVFQVAIRGNHQIHPTLSEASKEGVQLLNALRTTKYFILEEGVARENSVPLQAGPEYRINVGVFPSHTHNQMVEMPHSDSLIKVEHYGSPHYASVVVASLMSVWNVDQYLNYCCAKSLSI